MRRLLLVAAAVLCGLGGTVAPTPLAETDAAAGSPVYRIDHVVDGDTVALRNGRHVRLVQIDTPEVYFGAECYGRAASRTTKRLLPAGTRVRLLLEPGTDSLDRYGRLLRYVVRVNDAVNVTIRAPGGRRVECKPSPTRPPPLGFAHAAILARARDVKGVAFPRPFPGPSERDAAQMADHKKGPVSGAFLSGRNLSVRKPSRFEADRLTPV